MPPELVGVNLLKQTEAEANAKSFGCIHCHQNVGDPHFKDTVRLGCTDCHGGDASTTVKEEAHVAPRFPSLALVRQPGAVLHAAQPRAPEFIRFVNPGDLRIAHISCGTANCHPKEVLQVRKSMMTHGCMLWGAALYNNGAVPLKKRAYGESYSMNGVPQRLQTVPPPDEWETHQKGVRAVPRSAAPLRDQPAGQHPSHLRARRQIPSGGRHPRARTRIPAGPSHASQQPRPRHRRTAPTRLHRPAEDPPARSRRSTSWAPTTTPATTAPAAAPPAT